MKGLIIFENDIEDAEAVFTRDLLIRCGIDMISTSISGKMITTSYGLKIETNIKISDVVVDEYNFLVIPGGKWVIPSINNENILRLITSFRKQNKLIAAICAAPVFLDSILENTRYTCYPGCQKYLENGIYMEEKKVVLDNNIITGKSVSVVIDFCMQIIEVLKGAEAVKILCEQITYK